MRCNFVRHKIQESHWKVFLFSMCGTHVLYNSIETENKLEKVVLIGATRFGAPYELLPHRIFSISSHVFILLHNAQSYHLYKTSIIRIHLIAADKLRNSQQMIGKSNESNR